MSSVRSFLALYAAPNTRGAGPRPPRWVLAALAVFWVAVAALVTGCAPDPTRATIGLGYDVDPEPWYYATAEWYRASGGRVDLRVVENDASVDVHVAIVPLPCGVCGRTVFEGADPTGEIWLADSGGEGCENSWHTVAMHELGHYMGAEHTDVPRDVMHAHNLRTATLSAADVAQVVGP